MPGPLPEELAGPERDQLRLLAVDVALKELERVDPPRAEIVLLRYFVGLSIDETASLHEGFKEMMVLVTGTRVFGDGSIWWVAAYGFLLGGVGTRLLVDMRECFLSTAVSIQPSWLKWDG